MYFFVAVGSQLVTFGYIVFVVAEGSHPVSNKNLKFYLKDHEYSKMPGMWLECRVIELELEQEQPSDPPRFG